MTEEKGRGERKMRGHKEEQLKVSQRTKRWIKGWESVVSFFSLVLVTSSSSSPPFVTPILDLPSLSLFLETSLSASCNHTDEEKNQYALSMASTNWEREAEYVQTKERREKSDKCWMSPTNKNGIQEETAVEKGWCHLWRVKVLISTLLHRYCKILNY